MKRATLGVVTLLCCFIASADDLPKRPRIVGIGSVSIYSRNREDALDFYSNRLGYRKDTHSACASAPHNCIGIDSGQRLDIISPSSPAEGHFVGEITFQTNDIYELRSYLNSRQVKTSEVVKTAGDRTHYFTLGFNVIDPESHPVGFVEYEGCVVCEGDPDGSVGRHLIHAGFVVHDRNAEDKFYKDILGFHVYWHGGRKDDETDWVDMQVPDGADWIEYMLNVPANADHRLLGVMNHIALGVPDIHAAEKQLRANGWSGDEQPKIGRDGKWQLNLYDPDQTRVELMEFTPTKEPCCSPYTGPHPKP